MQSILIYINKYVLISQELDLQIISLAVSIN